jgi:hypothetical protein
LYELSRYYGAGATEQARGWGFVEAEATAGAGAGAGAGAREEGSGWGTTRVAMVGTTDTARDTGRAYAEIASAANPAEGEMETLPASSPVAVGAMDAREESGGGVRSPLAPRFPVRLLSIRPRSRGERRSLRTFPVVTLHPRFPFNV